MRVDKKQTKLKIITSGAFAAALMELVSIYQKKYYVDVDLSFGSSHGTAHDSAPTRLANGERFDLYFLARSAMDEFTAKGFILEGSGVDLVESHIGAMVRNEDLALDISTVTAFKKTLLASKSIAYSSSASGIYLSTEVFSALGISKEMQKTARPILSERDGSVLMRKEADLGFQQISEILPIQGVKVIGRLPEPYLHAFHFCVGIDARKDNIEEAKQLMRFVASQEVAHIIRNTGLDPLFPNIE